MKVKELIAKLQVLPQESEIMILDSFNSGHFPRTINLGPTSHIINEGDQFVTADAEDLPLGNIVYVLGYGCY